MAGIALASAFVSGIAIGWAIVPIVLGGAAVLRLAGLRIHLAWLGAAFLIAVLGVLRAPSDDASTDPDWIDNASAVRGEVVSGPLRSGSQQRFDLRIEEVLVSDSERWLQVNGRICASAPLVPEVGLGSKLVLRGSPQSLNEERPSIARSFAARGCIAEIDAGATEEEQPGRGLLAALDRVRRSITDRMQAASPGDTGALLAGLVTGDDHALSRERRVAFVRTGTTHITAVSGSNVALVVVALSSIGEAAGLRRHWGWAALTAGAVWTYAVLVGLGPPAVRAALVATGALIAMLLGRRPDLVTLLAMAAAIELAWRPEDLQTLSFRLSIASSLALSLVLPGMMTGGRWANFWAAVVGTASAQLATMPFQVGTFGTVSLTTVPANLLIVPAVGIAFPLAFIAAGVGFVSETLARAILFPAELLTRWIILVVEWLAGTPAGNVAVGRADAAVAVSAFLAVASIVALSAECRSGLSRLWRAAQRFPRARAVIGAGAGAALAGALLALLSH